MYSSRISSAIEKIHDSIARELENAEEATKKRVMPAVMDHLPDALKPYADRIHTNVPWPYVLNIVAAQMASRLVYTEGLAFVENCRDTNLAQVAFDYVEQEARVKQIVASVRKSNLPNAKEVADLLEKGGVRAALKL
jgi:glutamate dehydrogenase